MLLRNFIKGFILFIINNIIAHIPSNHLRKIFLYLLGLKIGTKSFINSSFYILGHNKINIGSYTHINRGCFLDGRGGITIGNSVSISHNVSIITGSHNLNSSCFEGIHKPITIEDYVWIGANATILQGVRLGKGSVVAAGSVVTKDVNDYCVVGGIPAVVIGNRNHNLNYKCTNNHIPFI